MVGTLERALVFFERPILIISQVIGGLGNQMFQYAAGRALSLKRGQPLKLDISGFSGYGLHQGFELQRIFNCSAELASKSEIYQMLGWQSLTGVRAILARPSLNLFRCSRFVVEPHFNYWPELSQVPNDCYLMGYWQSEKYFRNHSLEVRKEFFFKVPLTGDNAELALKISKVNAVSLHVRRGDYVADPKASRMHGSCSNQYYESAIEYIVDRVERPHFFVFSDDIEWVKLNLNVDGVCHYVGHNQGAESFNDMHLMSLCDHHIIANSSFSWWGAWLNAKTEKIVIAPKKWFAVEKNTADLLPEDWVTL